MRNVLKTLLALSLVLLVLVGSVGCDDSLYSEVDTGVSTAETETETVSTASVTSETSAETTEETTVTEETAVETTTTEAATTPIPETTSQTYTNPAPQTDPVVYEPPITEAEAPPVYVGGEVWIPTNGGTKYHTNSGCSNMKNPRNVSQAEAESMGFTPCKRCH